MVSLSDDFPPDQVVRKNRFQSAHPEWHFISPQEPRALLRGETHWQAIGPGGDRVRERQLGELLDELEKKTAPTEGSP
jgi:hypothetical protein